MPSLGPGSVLSNHPWWKKLLSQGKTCPKPIETYTKPIATYTKPTNTYSKPIETYTKPINTYTKPMNTYIYIYTHLNKTLNNL